MYIYILTIFYHMRPFSYKCSCTIPTLELEICQLLGMWSKLFIISLFVCANYLIMPHKMQGNIEYECRDFLVALVDMK